MTIIFVIIITGNPCCVVNVNDEHMKAKFKRKLAVKFKDGKSVELCLKLWFELCLKLWLGWI